MVIELILNQILEVPPWLLILNDLKSELVWRAEGTLDSFSASFESGSW